MPTLNDLKKKLETVEDLESVVKTMKALAAVNIRQYEEAAASLEVYYRTVELGFRAALLHSPPGAGAGETGRLQASAAIVFGSDQGMAGRFNEEAVEKALAGMKDAAPGDRPAPVLAVGDRVRGLLEDGGRPAEGYVEVPTSPAGITAGVQNVLLYIDMWRDRYGPAAVHLYFNRHDSGAAYHPVSQRLLPLDREWLDALREKKWPQKGLPTFNMDRDRLFAALVRQYLFAALYRAFAESLAGENAARLAAMQSAERNIQDKRTSLQNEYHQQRQMAITEELLDIVAGFSALSDESGSEAA